jgi:mannose-6-phosphate isomerase-like protein (cupin superfamily)
MAMRALTLFLLAVSFAAGAEREVAPTFLYRHVPSLKTVPSDVTTDTCRYKAIFGVGDSARSILRGVARYGEVEVDSNGACTPVSYEAEEQIYVVLDGSGTLLYGEEKYPLKKDDFLYLPAGIRHGVETAGSKCRFIVMGFRLPRDADKTPPPKLLIANLSDVKKEVVGGHPPSTLYQLMLGDVKSKRDKIAAGRVVTSLFIMNFTAGGTNFPHAHDSEEEIYVLLDGEGEMVAGGGVDGVENRRPAKPGDAYCYRLNTTVGFYNRDTPGASARILAVRSLYPRRR